MANHNAPAGSVAWRIVGWLIVYLSAAALILLLATILYYVIATVAWLA